MAGTRSAGGALRPEAADGGYDKAIALLRIILGGLFVFASLGKIADPHAFASSIEGYRILEGDAALHIATVLPWVEFLSGCLLLVGVFIRGSASLVFLMLLLFTAAVLSALWRGLDISCGCYTQDPAAGQLGWWKAGENTVLAVVAFLVFRHRRTVLTIRQVFAHPVRPAAGAR
jgi:putative oxidoreductase